MGAKRYELSDEQWEQIICFTKKYGCFTKKRLAK